MKRGNLKAYSEEKSIFILFSAFFIVPLPLSCLPLGEERQPLIGIIIQH